MDNKIRDDNTLPKRWKHVKVADVSLKIHYGFTATSSEINTGTKYLRITDIQDGHVNWQQVPYCKIENEEIERYNLREGDIVFARTGGTVGKSYLIDKHVPKDTVFASYLIRIVLNNLVMPKYVSLFFQSLNYWGQIELNKTGLKTNVNAQILSQIKLTLPPLPEQERIVTKIEELFSELDKGVEALKTVREQLKVYRQAVLKYAFEGKLTDNWRKENLKSKNAKFANAETLLSQIKAEREKQYKEACKKAQAEGKRPPKKLKDVLALSASELAPLPKLPETWAWRRLEDMSEEIQIGPFGSQVHSEDYTENGVPIVNPKRIKDQKIYPHERISFEKANSLPQYKLRTNDVLLGRRGEMGRSAPITAKENGWFCGTGSLYIRLGGNFIAKLYSLILSERRIVRYLENESIGTTMTNLNSEILKNLIIQIIPFSEQLAIVEEIETRLSVCDKLEETVDGSLKQAEALRQSILKKAFEGKLV